MTREKRVRACRHWEFPHTHTTKGVREVCPLEV